MKKASWIPIFFFLLPLTLLGLIGLLDTDQTVSATENRRLTPMPSFSLSALMDGSWAAGFSSYYADAFPLRERLLAANTGLNAFYAFSPFPADSGEATLAVPFGGDQVAHADPAPTEASPQPDEAFTAGDVLLVGDRAMYTGWLNEKIIARYGDAVTALASALEDLPVTSMLIPNSGAFYAPEKWRTGQRNQADIIAAAYAALPERVRTADAYGALAPHTEEYIYFRSDHHWTQRGAYYGYTALCAALGLTPRPLADSISGVLPGDFLGSFYTLLSAYPQAAALAGAPDKVEYWRGGSLDACVCTAYETADMAAGSPCAVLDLQYAGTNLYEAFFGGDKPLLKLETGADTGRTALVVKDSQANALLPFLLEDYDCLYIVDPRYFNLSEKPVFDLPAFAAANGVDEVLLINGEGILNNETYQRYLAALVPAE